MQIALTEPPLPPAALTIPCYFMLNSVIQRNDHAIYKVKIEMEPDQNHNCTSLRKKIQ